MISNIKAKLQNKHFLSLAGNIIMAGLGFVTVGILLRALTPVEIGSFFFFQTAFVLVDTFRTGFLQTAMIKFYAGADDARASNVVGSTWYIGLIITALSFVLTVPVMFFLHYISNEGIRVTLQWFSVSFLSTLPIVVATWVLQAEQRFDRILYVRLINQGSFIIMVILLIAFKRINLQTLMWANFLGCVFTCIYLFAKRWTHLGKLKYRSKESINELVHFGKYSVGTSISSNLLRSSDTFIINALLGTAAVAVYNIPQKFLEIIEIPLRSFLATGTPELSAAYNQDKKQEIGTILNKYAGMLTIAFIPVALVAIAFADIGVSLFSGGKYTHTEAANVFRIFMVFAVFFPVDRFFGVTLDVIHQPKRNAIKVFLMLVINVVGDFAGIWLLHNIYGVAIASIPTFLFGVLFGYYSLKKFLPVSFKGIFSTGFAEVKLLVQNALNKPNLKA